MTDTAQTVPSRSLIREWIASRWSTLRMVLLGTASYPLVFAACWRFWPEMAPLNAPVDRALLALQLSVLPAAVLSLCVFMCLRLLDTPGAENILAGEESHRWKLNARVLQNSLEQAAMFVPILIGLAIRIDPGHVRALPILVAIWTAGRLLFWLGIHRKLEWRAIGFDWTYYSSFVGLGWFVWTLF